MNTQDVVTRVRRVFGDEAAVQVTDADIIRWINDGQVEVVKSNDSALQKTDFVNLVAGQSTYTVPTDFLILRSLRYKFSDMQSFSHLRFMSVQTFDEAVDGWDGTYYTQGHPQFFTVDDGQLILFPTPESSMTAGLKVRYNKKPVDVTALGDVLSLPLIYHNTVVKYCLWQASLMDEDHEVAAMYSNGFQVDMDLLRSKETQDPTNTYQSITCLAEDM